MKRNPTERRALRVTAWAAAAATTLLAGCASAPNPDAAAALQAARSVTITRTTYGIPHVQATNFESLAYGVAYAHAQDNVCQTAQQLVTVRGERSRWFGPQAQALLGHRSLPNEQIDAFIGGHMNDAALVKASAASSADSQALMRGYVAGYNRFLKDRDGQLPSACAKAPWVRPMRDTDYLRLQELSLVQAGIALFADAWIGAQPPAPKVGAAPAPTTVSLADAADAMRAIGAFESPLGSNAWAFGKDVTANGSGLLLGNPHFPWSGVNRFYQMHLTVPGQLDVMGASTGHTALVHIGFNRDVAWSHTVSTGKRFTLFELKLVEGDPTSYLVDGQPEKMSTREIAVEALGGDHQVQTRRVKLWSTRWGPVVVIPRAGLNWTASKAYALKDANSGNLRALDSWLAINRARNVEEVHAAHANLGIPWVNTIAADREGRALYTDVSVVPDVDAEQLQRCMPSPQLGALRLAAGLVVLDGSRADCDWRRDPASPVPGLTPIGRMPKAVRSDWVMNSNDSYRFTHPQQRFEGIGPLVGENRVERGRTRASLQEIPELLAKGKVTPQAVQAQLFGNRNTLAEVVLPDLLGACASAPDEPTQAGCAVLKSWDRRNNLESRGAHLFHEFWRVARNVPGVHRVAADPAQPVATPAGVKMADAAVAGKVWEALGAAVGGLRKAGIALDATLGSVQRPATVNEPIGLHGGDELVGVLNNLGNRFAPVVTAQGLRIDYGASYLQTVTFDAEGPRAEAILTYGQSSDPASPHAADQMLLYSRKQWHALPFSPAAIARQRLGEPLTLVR